MRGVAAPGGLRLVERGAEPDRDHRVLQRHPPARVRVDIARGHTRHSEPLRQLGEQTIAPTVVPRERPLQLHPEAIRAERTQEAPADSGRGRVLAPLHARGESTVARAAGQAHQPLRIALDVLERHHRRSGLCRPHTRALVRTRDQPAEVSIAVACLAQQR